MNKKWYQYLGWVFGAGLLGFAIAAFFAGVLRLPRSIYLIPYVGLSGLFFYTFVRWSRISISGLFQRHWYWGVLGGAILAVWTVGNILSQPASPRAEGFSLVIDVLWAGAIYGLTDALLLSVLPVLATWQAFSLLNWTARWPGKIATGGIAVFASLVVIVAYHLGYPECRSSTGLFGPVLGNTAMTLGYLVATNPLASVISHMAMHIAAVFQGPESMLQLPPHY